MDSDIPKICDKYTYIELLHSPLSPLLLPLFIDLIRQCQQHWLGGELTQQHWSGGELTPN